MSARPPSGPPVTPPARLPDTGTGPDPVPGRLDLLAPGLSRLTAANPGVMTGPGTNTYLVGGAGNGSPARPPEEPGGSSHAGHERELAVVDPGPEDASHLEAIERAVAARGGVVRWVLVTHTHPDHAPGARALAASSGAELVGFGARDGFTPDVAVGDGWTIATPSFTLRALSTPGHASDHLCYLVDLRDAAPGDTRRVLLSGDHVMDRVTVVIAPPDGDMGQYLSSLERLLALDPPLDAIAPGHGRLLADPATVVRSVLEHRLAREALVKRAMEDARTASVDDLVPAVYGDVVPELHPIARLSLWAHLRKLAADGHVDEVPGEGSPTYRVREHRL